MRRLLRRWARIDPRRLLQVSAVLTLLALGLMVWSMLVPTPLPVMLAMTVGQGIGTLAFGLYGYVVIADVWRARRARRAAPGDGDGGGDGGSSGSGGGGDGGGEAPPAPAEPAP